MNFPYMFIALVPTFYFLLWLILFNRNRQKGLRRTFLEAALLTFAIIAVSTETLSLFSLINLYSLILLWGGASLVLFGYLKKNTKSGAREFWDEFAQKLKCVPKTYLILASSVFLVTFVISAVSPPHTYDSMTYHLARIANWIQAGNVGFYPTAILRQLYQPPLAEYAILHFHLLGGGDFFANFIEWFALVACGVVVSLIVLELGYGIRTQAFAAVIAVTLPTAVVQSSSTQNDLVVSLFILAFFYFFLRAVKSNSWTNFAWTGIALGLAVLTKGTAYFFCFPIGAAFVAVHFFTLKKLDARLRFAKQIAIVLLIAAAFSSPHYARNYQLFGSAFSTGEEKMTNQNVTVRMVFSNLARNYAIHLGIPSDAWKDTLENVLTSVFGDELKNPDSTLAENPFTFSYSTHEVSAGNFAHILFITVALLLVFLFPGDNRKYVLILAFSVLTGFVLFSAVLKWQSWASRLQTPLFLVGAILPAIVIARHTSRMRSVIAFFCFIVASPALFFGVPRSVFSNEGKFVLTEETRRKKFFVNLPSIEPLYTEAVDFIRRQPNLPDSIGLYIENNDFEYPLWFLLKEDFRQKPAIYHVGVPNISAKLAGTRPLPEFVISTRTEMTIEDVEYKEVWGKNAVRVLQKKEIAAP